MNENFIIDKYFKPLSKNYKEALNLSDDAAVLKVLKSKNLVISVDNFIYGIHCPKYINISNGVNRAILAAISDLSAMAAKPYCIFISISLNKNNISTKNAWHPQNYNIHWFRRDVRRWRSLTNPKRKCRGRTLRNFVIA